MDYKTKELYNLYRMNGQHHLIPKTPKTSSSVNVPMKNWSKADRSMLWDEVVNMKSSIMGVRVIKGRQYQTVIKNYRSRGGELKVTWNDIDICKRYYERVSELTGSNDDLDVGRDYWINAKSIRELTKRFRNGGGAGTSRTTNNRRS